jgi:hypothetical protein
LLAFGLKCDNIIFPRADRNKIMAEQSKLFLWNNQNLFSNNYLEHRLPETDLWKGQREKASDAFESIKKVGRKTHV